MIHTIADLITPHYCISCGQIGEILCVNCKKNIDSMKCAECLLCSKKHKVPCCGDITDTWYVGAREDILKDLINVYKFERVVSAGNVLATLLDKAVDDLPPDTIVTWIPTTPNHIRQRGYDHAKKIAVCFAKLRGLSCKQLLSRRSFYTQHRATRATRIKQAKEAFVYSKEFVSKSCLLIDDIYTTGATIRSAAKELKKAGVKNVFVAVVAKQPEKK